MKIDDDADLRPDPPSWRDLNTQMSGKNDNYEGGEHDNYCMKMIIMKMINGHVGHQKCLVLHFDTLVGSKILPM